MSLASRVSSSELHDGIELEAGLRRVVCEGLGALARHEGPVDEVREPRARAQGERVQQLIIETDERPLRVGPAEAEVAPREGGYDGVLLEILVQDIGRPITQHLRLPEPQSGLQ